MAEEKNKKDKNKSGGKIETQKPKERVIKIEVVETDYLSHDFSPHIIDLKSKTARKTENFLIKSEPTDNYFTGVKSKLLGLPILPPKLTSLKTEEETAAEIRQKIEELRKEIEQMEDITMGVEWPPAISFVPASSDKEMILDAETWELPEIIPAAASKKEIIVEEISIDQRGVVKKIILYLDSGVNRLAQPLRRLPFSKPVKASLGFIILALILVLPLGGLSYYRALKGKESGILDITKAAVQNLGSAGKAVGSQDYAEANSEFNSAYQKFSTAKEELGGVNKLVTTLASLLPSTDKALDTANSLLQIGQDLSVVGQNLTNGLAAWEDDNKKVSDKILVLEQNLESSAPLIKNVEKLVTKVDVTQLLSQEQFKFLQLQQKMPLISISFNKFIALADLAENILGQHELKRYLLLFQNNHEIRPTGGFIGSFALLDLVDGEIRKIEIPAGGSYDLQGSLKAKVASPQPLHLINNRWEFQDSNWFPDWPTAAQKIIWFYNQAGGPTVDGVIAINADLLADLLKIIGPVETDGKAINADNFFEVTQKAVELEYDKAENEPKQFIADLAPEVLGQILKSDKDKFLAIITLLNQALTARDLQMYFVSPGVENKLSDLGWSGRIKNTDKDYLMVVDANIAGKKSDAVIKQKILHQAKIYEDGRVVDKVTIIRTHEGIPEELFYGVRNVNYLRLYVPEGSKLISASGLQEPAADLFPQNNEDYKQDLDLLRISGLTRTDKVSGVKINNEFGKTVFGGWTQVYPGKTAITTFEYELPFKVTFAKYDTGASWLNKLEEKLNWTETTSSYSLLVQKQSGIVSEFYSLVDLPAEWQEVWRYPADLKITDGELIYNNYLDKDQVYSVMFKK
jgi:type III secretion system FlhB-like substrate exporter